MKTAADFRAQYGNENLVIPAHVEEILVVLEARDGQVARLMEAGTDVSFLVEAMEHLLVCYRLGRHPPEKVLSKLSRYEHAGEDLEAAFAVVEGENRIERSKPVTETEKEV